MTPTFSARNRSHNEFPNALVFDEIKEVETSEDDDLAVEATRFEPFFWYESAFQVRQSFYLGQTFRLFLPPTKPCDRLRC